MASKTLIDRKVLEHRIHLENEKFEKSHLKSQEMHQRASKSMIAGVPMSWMLRLPGKWPIFVKSGNGSRFVDVDNNKYIDFCLGDTGAMTGHAPGVVVEAASQRLKDGYTFMLPVEDAFWVTEELTHRFGLPYWQMAMTATDANRFVLRLARQITGRKKILVFNYCYHGTVDETLATIQEDGSIGPRPGNIGPAADPAITTKVVEFNDIGALQAALEPGDVAAVLTEPALTNIGIILPIPEFHKKLREITRKTGTLLIIDETHTICGGPGGCTKRWGLEPDFLTIGKPIAGGIPAAVYGMTENVARQILDFSNANKDILDCGGVGGTLTANALALSAMRATLKNILTQEAFDRMEKLAIEWTDGVQRLITKYNLPWVVQRLGCRAEYWFREVPPNNGGEAAHACDPELESYMHLAALNRGVLLTPFHNMALMCPETTTEDVAAHTKAFEESVQALFQ